MKEIYMDIHSHIIPGVDDGSKSMEQSIKMMDQSYDQGIRVIIATPHFGVVNYDYDLGYAKAALRELKLETEKRHPDLKIFMGNEIYYTQGIAEDLLAGKAKSLAGTAYVLVEFNTGVEADMISRAIDEFNLNGYKPIIAHAERYECLEGSEAAVRELIDRGAYIQLNCRSILGGRNPGAGRKKRKTGFSLEDRAKWCRKLLEADLVHFIASDCHDEGNRAPIFKDAVSTMLRWIGEEKTLQIVNRNIISLIRNEAID
ncbi:MAG: hypothetical protein PHS19_03525 [Eubacteriales bacterium]|nr:hypothetical protein [Eubacteriales bacterium]